MEDLLTKLRSEFHGNEWYFSKHNKIISKNNFFIKYPALQQIPSAQKEKIELLAKINPRIIDSVLLKMEMQSSLVPEKLSTDDAVKKTIELLSKYQWKCGGYHIDSLKWGIVTKKNAKEMDYTITDNSTILVNTVNTDLEGDFDTTDFIDILQKKLETLSENHEIGIKTYKKDDDSNYRTEIAIWITQIERKKV